jgi:hypothetical protein
VDGDFELSVARSMKRNWRWALVGGLALAVCIGLTVWSGLALVRQQAFQEYIVVRVKDRPAARADVLINGEKNGMTGEVITLGSRGWVFISVDLPKAKPKNLNVKNTTPSHPMQVEIDCSEPPARPTPTANHP